MAKTVAENTAYSTVAAGIGFSVNLVTSIIVARELGPTAFGIYSLLIWLRTMVGTLIDFGFSNAIARYWPELIGKGERALAKAVASRLFLLQVGIVLIFWLLFIQARFSIASILDKPHIAEYIPLTATSLTITVMLTFMRAFIAGTQQFRARMLTDIASSLTLIAAIILLLIQDWLIVRNLLYVDIFVGALQLTLLSIILHRYISFRSALAPGHKIKLGLVRYCIGVFTFTTLYSLLMQRAETFFIARFHSVEQVAFFNLSHNIAMSLMVMLPASLATVIMPTLAKSHGKNDLEAMKSTFQHATRFLAFLTFPIGIGGFTVTTALVQIVYGANYAPVGPVLRIMFVSALFSSMVMIIIPVFWAFGESVEATLWLLPNAIFAVGISYLLVLRSAAIGAALSNAITQMLLCISGLFYLRYRHGFSIVPSDLFRIGSAAVLVAFLANLSVRLFGPGVGLIIGVVTSAVLYLPALILFHAITVDDLDAADRVWDLLPVSLSRVLKYATYRVRSHVVRTNTPSG